MSGYIHFRSTGVEPVDRILVAVEEAGRMFHHTDGWVDGYPEDKDPSMVDLIQRAADQSASELRRFVA